jgi:predicted dehydrogenase
MEVLKGELIPEEMMQLQDSKKTKMKSRRQFLKSSVFAGIGVTTSGIQASCDQSNNHRKESFNIGIIGLDTSHSPAFAKYINNPEKESMQGMQVSVAYPFGSKRIKSSANKIPEYTEQFKSMGIKIENDLDDLIEQSDGILLETNDGTMHLNQAMKVIQAGKPLFIDKPVAAGLADVIEIYETAKKNKVPIFSSSSLRYLKKAQDVQKKKIIGDVKGANTYSPEKLEPSHTDLFWYGIHGVEILYTLMGTGCQSVNRITTKSTDFVIGKWDNERLGTFRGDLSGLQQYGGTAFGTEGVLEVGPFDGYGDLIEEIIKFFRTGKSPVPESETIELYTFMEAADVSKERKSNWVELSEVYNIARKN